MWQKLQVADTAAVAQEINKPILAFCFFFRELLLVQEIQTCLLGFEAWNIHERLGGGFKYFLFSSLLGEDSHFD